MADPQDSGQTPEKEAPEAGAVVRPAILAAEAKKKADAEAAEAADEAQQKAAFARANTAPVDEKKKKPEDYSGKPGFAAVVPPHPSDIDVKAPVFPPHFDTGGKGWVTARDEKGKTHRVRDDGHSIFIPGVPTATQMALVAQLAQQKGWTSVAVYKKSGHELHDYGTKLLRHVAPSLKVHTDIKSAGKLHHNLDGALDTFRQTLMERHKAAHPQPGQS